MQNLIRYLSRQEIDTQKWDTVVSSNGGATLYGYTASLDILCADWQGLVYADYEAVMPIAWNRKYGIRYLFTPAFIQRFSIYGNNVNKELQGLFIEELIRRFRYIDIDLSFKPSSKYGHIKERTNLITFLKDDISVIHNRYTDQAHKSLRQALGRACRFGNDISIREVISLYKDAYGTLAAYVEADFNRLAQLAVIYESQGKLIKCVVRDNNTGAVFFGALLFNVDAE